MSSWIEDMVAAAGRHGVPCVVIGGAPGGNGVAPSEFVGRHDEPPGGNENTGGGSQEMEQLRAQVQALTSERDTWQERVAVINAESAERIAAGHAGGADQLPVVTPTGDNGSHRDVSTEAMGLEEEKLTNKLIRLGYDTAGKVSDAYNEGKLAEAKLKKDWLISVGMAIAGMFARSGGSAPTVSTGGGGEPAGDVPDGHVDRPWMHRLGLARDKHKELSTHQESLAEVRTKYDKRVKVVKKAGNDPDDDDEVDSLGDQIIDLEEDVKLVTAHCVALKWSLGLNPVPQEKTLDESLLEANLGPWCEQPQPRVLAGAGA